MTDFVTIHLRRVNREQLDILQSAVRLSGDNLDLLYQKGILSEDYVAAYAGFLKALGNEFTRASDLFYSPTIYPSGIEVNLFDFDHLPCGGELDMKGGAADEK